MNSQFSIVYQITQECLFNCEICLRHFKINNEILKQQERYNIVSKLKNMGLKRLAVTGGEPTLLGQELYDFLKFVHDQRIHTSLVTTGIHLTHNRITELNSYIDHILISVRSLEAAAIVDDFKCDITTAHNLLNSIYLLLDVSKKCDFILEVNTVVHKQNFDSILDLGNILLGLNPNIIWRIDEYYPIGFRKSLRNKFELGVNDFDEIINDIYAQFEGKFFSIRHLSNKRRSLSPEFLITQSGKLITTSNYVETKTAYDLRRGKFPENFSTLRPWLEHNNVCRDFGWQK